MCCKHKTTNNTIIIKYDRPHSSLQTSRPVRGFCWQRQQATSESDERPYNVETFTHTTRNIPPNKHSVHSAPKPSYASCPTQTTPISHTREQRLQQIRQGQFSVQSARVKKHSRTRQTRIDIFSDFQSRSVFVQYRHRTLTEKSQ